MLWITNSPHDYVYLRHPFGFMTGIDICLFRGKNLIRFQTQGHCASRIQRWRALLTHHGPSYLQRAGILNFYKWILKLNGICSVRLWLSEQTYHLFSSSYNNFFFTHTCISFLILVYVWVYSNVCMCTHHLILSTVIIIEMMFLDPPLGTSGNCISFPLQGRALLDTANEAFGESLGLGDLRSAVLNGRMNGHLPVIFGAMCALLSIGQKSACNMFMYNCLKTIMASSVRLGFIGTLQVCLFLIPSRKKMVEKIGFMIQ